MEQLLAGDVEQVSGGQRVVVTPITINTLTGKTPIPQITINTLTGKNPVPEITINTLTGNTANTEF